MLHYSDPSRRKYEGQKLGSHDPIRTPEKKLLRQSHSFGMGPLLCLITFTKTGCAHPFWTLHTCACPFWFHHKGLFKNNVTEGGEGPF